MKRFAYVLFIALLVPTVAAADEYSDSIYKWQQERDSILRRPDGWLTLAGLFWLEPGVNRFGSGLDCAVCLPRGPKNWGTLSLKGEQLECRLKGAAPQLLVDGKDANRAQLDLKRPEGSNRFSGEGLIFFPIKRDGRWAIRLKDTQSATLANFKGMSYFATEPKWRLKAHYEAYAAPRRTKVTTMMQTQEDEDYPGDVVIEYQAKTYRCLAVGEPGSDSYSLNFSDKTNGKSSYGGGRYLYFTPPKGGVSGDVVLDFNQAFTPPCGFTHFATCSLVPKENRLPFAIEAGERFSNH